MSRGIRSSLFRDQALVLLIAGLIFFLRLGAADLFDEDEARNAVCGREMSLRNDWIVPTFNGALRTDKPILLYWMMRAAIGLFGVNEFSARFASAALSVGTSLAVYHLGRKLFDRETGLVSAVIASTSTLFLIVGRQATPDSSLIFLSTSAMLAWVWTTASHQGGRFGGAEDESAPRPWSDFAPRRRSAFFAVYALMGLAMLAKGPVGFVLPCAVIGMFLLLRQEFDRNVETETPAGGTRSIRRGIAATGRIFHPARIVAATRVMRWPVGLVVALAVSLPWYGLVGWATQGAWLVGFLGRHNVTRFLAPLENHRGPIIYYLPVLIIGLLPWSVFLPASLRHAGRRLRDRADRGGVTFLTAWVGVWLVVFSIARTKLPNYVAPTMPALSLLIGHWLMRWQRESNAAELKEFRRSCQWLAGLSVVFLAVFFWAARRWAPGDEALGLLVLWTVTGFPVAARLAHREHRGRAILALAATAVASALTFVAFVPERIARRQDGPAMGRAIRAIPESQRARIAAVEYFMPSIVYYGECRIDLPPREQWRDYFTKHPEAWVITRDDRRAELAPALSPEARILVSVPRFFQRHRVILCERASDTGQDPKMASDKVSPQR